MKNVALLTILALGLGWLALGGVYATRPGPGASIYRVNRFTGAIAICAPEYETVSGRRVVICR